MMALDMGVAVFSERDTDGFVNISYDGYQPPNQKAGIGAVEAHHPFGFQGRPRDPEQDSQGSPGIGATVLRFSDQNGDHLFPLGDPRTTPKLPTVGKGGSIQYGDTGAPVVPFAFFDVANGGGWQCYVPYSGSPPTKAMTIAIDVSTPGQESIQIIHGSGMSITITAGGKNSIVIKNKAGDAYLEVNDDGTITNGNTQMVGGLAVGIPTPAHPGPAPEAVARAPELVSWAASVNVTLAAIKAALAVPAGPGPLAAAVKIDPTIPVTPALAGTVTATKLSTT